MSSDLRELYQQVILDHGRHPRNVGVMTDCTHQQEGFNPLCGDQITIFLRIESGVIQSVQFQGTGCAISMATASLMTQALTGQRCDAFPALFDAFHALVTGQGDAERRDQLGKLAVLEGVAQYPMRVKCATLAWHTLRAALQADHGGESVSTESTETTEATV